MITIPLANAFASTQWPCNQLRSTTQKCVPSPIDPTKHSRAFLWAQRFLDTTIMKRELPPMRCPFQKQRYRSQFDEPALCPHVMLARNAKRVLSIMLRAAAARRRRSTELSGVSPGVVAKLTSTLPWLPAHDRRAWHDLRVWVFERTCDGKRHYTYA
eukprot:5454472-Pleurochrysis_carterae.AAC.1